MEDKVKVDNSISEHMSLLHNLPGCFTKKKHFRDNGISLTGEVKHKLMRFVKYLLTISCFLASWLRSLPVFAFLHCSTH